MDWVSEYSVFGTTETYDSIQNFPDWVEHEVTTTTTTTTNTRWEATQRVMATEHSNEHSDSIKEGEFLDYLSDYWHVKKDSVPCSYLLSI